MRKLLIISLAFSLAFVLSSGNVLAKKFTNIPKENLLFLEVLIVTLIILIFGEIIPKTFAVNRSIYFSNLISIPIIFLLLLLYLPAN